MRAGRLIIFVGALWLSGAAVAALTPAASVSSSPSRAGARAVVLTLRLHYEMQCGYPGQGPVVIGFPAQMRLPRTLHASSVLVNGKPTSRVEISRNQVSVPLPRRSDILCDVLAPGTLTIVFNRSASLGNPSRAGRYLVTARRGSLRFLARLVITST
ncbi:MAG: hypothetical protein ABSC51_08295 [Gaiellaceae bacterium]|jgi:hypothetical protein